MSMGCLFTTTRLKSSRLVSIWDKLTVDNTEKLMEIVTEESKDILENPADFGKVNKEVMVTFGDLKNYKYFSR